MAKLAEQMARGPPKKPVGLVKKPVLGYEDVKEELKNDYAQGNAETQVNEGQKKLGDLMKQNPLKKDDKDGEKH